MRADLHTHTHCSDGSLSPGELLARARRDGVEMLAITDHDTLDAYAQLDDADTGDIELIVGIELSARWRRIGVHVVGLNVDRYSDIFCAAIAGQQEARLTRAQRIGERLAKLGFADSFEAAQRNAGDAHIGRPHFAAHLVEIGAVRDLRHAFKKYLGAGTPGDIKSVWPELEVVVEWIRAAGGVAVLAHPAKYKLTRTRLNALVTDFCAAGGGALEVVSGQQTLDVTAHLSKLCTDTGLLASCGSDFHHPQNGWAQLGKFGALPGACTPVWQAW